MTTTTQMVIVRKVGRDARSGRFVTLLETRRRPQTTVTEEIRIPVRRRR